MARRSAGWILAAILAVGAVTAQERKPRFEVASVKPQREPINAATLRGAAPRVMPGGVFDPTRASILSLLTFAYDLKPYQILGGPDWMRRDVFHIDARAGFDAPADQIKQMVPGLVIVPEAGSASLLASAIILLMSGRALRIHSVSLGACSECSGQPRRGAIGT